MSASTRESFGSTALLMSNAGFRRSRIAPLDRACQAQTPPRCRDRIPGFSCYTGSQPLAFCQ